MVPRRYNGSPAPVQPWVTLGCLAFALAWPASAGAFPSLAPLLQPSREPQWRLVYLDEDGPMEVWDRDRFREVWIEDGSSAFRIELPPDTVSLTRGSDWLPAYVDPWSLRVFDLNADGRVDAVAELRTQATRGCCVDSWFFTSDARGIRLWDAIPNSHGFEIEDLDGDGIPELVTNDYWSRYFSPFFRMSIPVVLCRTGGAESEGTYRNCTIRFPDVALKHVPAYERRLQDETENLPVLLTANPKLLALPLPSYWQQTPTIGIFVTYARLNREEEGFAMVERLCLDCAHWINENYAAISERVANPMPYGR